MGFLLSDVARKEKCRGKNVLFAIRYFFDIVYKTMEKSWEQYTLAGLIDPSKNFVDCKDLHLGDKNMFVGEING